MFAKNTFCFAAAFSGCLLVSLPSLIHAQSASQDGDEEEEEIVVLSPFQVNTSGGGAYNAATTLAGNRLNTNIRNVGNAVSVHTDALLGATPGGAQDINFYRMGAGKGQIPHPNTLTAEGLFSEHDLPLDLGLSADSLFFVQSAATTARFEVLPEIRYLAQLGFSSGLRAATWEPARLNLVAVVDKSGSMSGQPLALVRASLTSVLEQMREGDQLSIVLYGDRAHVHLDPMMVTDRNRSVIQDHIDSIQSAGSTFMEEGLRVGFRLARESARRFEGNTRVMLFTDERPNVGNTSAEGFMAMAESASEQGIGMTTIGVGVQFGAELATKISSVRGGNLFFFQDDEEMQNTFADDFDTMVTELAHDFSVRIDPAPGYRISGLFGLPAEAVRWDGKALLMDVATIFLSKRKGAIYFGLSPDREGGYRPSRKAPFGEELAHVEFGYFDAQDGTRVADGASCRLLSPDEPQIGLTRGTHLVDEYLTLKKVAQVHLFDNNQEKAFKLANQLLARLDASHDPDLEPEIELVRDINNTLARLSGNVGSVESVDQIVDPLSGLPGARGSLADDNRYTRRYHR